MAFASYRRPRMGTKQDVDQGDGTPGLTTGERHAGVMRRVRLAMIAWLAVVIVFALLGLTAALSQASLWSHVTAGRVAPQFERAGIAFNLVVLGVALALSALGGWFAPDYWRRLVLALVTLPAVVLAILSHNVIASMVVVGVFLPATWLGRELVGLAAPDADALESWAIGVAVGLGMIMVLGLVLGTMGILTSWVVLALLLLTVGVLCTTARQRLQRELGAFFRWACAATRPQPMTIFLTGIAIAYIGLNVVGALAPETSSDAVRQRLAVAARFAERGTLTTGDPDLGVASDPAAGEMAYAVVLTLGSFHAAKLLNLVVGLGCAFAIFALGRCIGGRGAGFVAALAFYSMSIVSWLSQNLYVDLFIALFAVAAALILLGRERIDWRAATLAGALLGLGISTKVYFGYVAVGVAALLFLLGHRADGFRRTLALGCVLGGGALLAALPWLARSFSLLGYLPGVALGAQSLSRTQGSAPAIMADLSLYGAGRSFPHLLLAPVELTLRSQLYEWGPGPAGPFGGHIGYVLLGFVPFLLLARPHWRVIALLAGATVAFVLWFYTAQYLRYALPILALLCPLAGIGYVAAGRLFDGAPRGLNIFLAVLTLAGVSVQLNIPAIGQRYAIGRESEAEYLERYLYCCNDSDVLRLLNAEPGASRTFVVPDSARLYSRVRLSSPSIGGADIAVQGSDALLLERLRAGGYSHIAIDRRLMSNDWAALTALDEGFLRRNTMLVGGGNNAYLYRLLPTPNDDSTSAWAGGTELVANGGFEFGTGSGPTGWVAVGFPVYDGARALSHTGTGAVRLTSQDTLASTATIRPDTTYLLSHATRSAREDGRAALHLDWRDATGKLIGSVDEPIPTSAEKYSTFSMLATAPATATTVTIVLRVEQGEVWFDDVSLRARSPEDTGLAASFQQGDARK
jgi:hypothetical protein